MATWNYGQDRPTASRNSKTHMPRKLHQLTAPSPPSKCRCISNPDHLESSRPRPTNASFQSCEPTKGGENDTIVSEECDMMEDMQGDTLVDMVAQLRVDKESDHVVWNDEVVLQQYQTLSLNSSRNKDLLQWDVRQAGRLLPLFVVTPRISSEMLPEILRLKEPGYDSLRYL